MNQWLLSKRIDLLVLFLPVWGCWIIFFSLPESFVQKNTPLWVWVVFIVGIDVSHVWSTLFRTYTDRTEFKNHRKLLIITPFICFTASFFISLISFSLFWRCIAYLAVYHFIKQQYGFMRIYKVKAKDFCKKTFKDNFIIYLTMLYPILYWHLNLDRNFNWFIEGDFLQVNLSTNFLSIFNKLGNAIYFALLIAWLLEEFIRKEKLAIGKILWILTTAGNWFIGIVYFNSDIVFTITNVIAHGIPYLALIIFYQTKKGLILNKSINVMRYSLSIVLLAFMLAIFEEYFWDIFVYRENNEFFSTFLAYPDFEFEPGWQHIALAILSVPQITHYVLDGFIWKNNDKNPHLKSILLG